MADEPNTQPIDLEELLGTMTIGEPLDGGTEKFGLGLGGHEGQVTPAEHRAGLSGRVTVETGRVEKLAGAIASRIK